MLRVQINGLSSHELMFTSVLFISVLTVQKESKLPRVQQIICFFLRIRAAADCCNNLIEK